MIFHLIYLSLGPLMKMKTKSKQIERAHAFMQLLPELLPKWMRILMSCK